MLLVGYPGMILLGHQILHYGGKCVFMSVKFGMLLSYFKCHVYDDFRLVSLSWKSFSLSSFPLRC